MKTVEFDEFWLECEPKVQEASHQNKFLSKIAWLPPGSDFKVTDPPELPTIEADIEKTLTALLSEFAPGLHILQHPMGAGKTTHALKAVVSIQSESSAKVGRTLILAKEKKRAIDIFREMEALYPEVCLFLGRQDSLEGQPPEEKWHRCQRLTHVSQIQARRYSAESYCKNCHEELEIAGLKCPYVASRFRAMNSPVVVGTHAAFLKGSRSLAEFSHVIIDEDPLNTLLERVSVSLDELTFLQEQFENTCELLNDWPAAYTLICQLVLDIRGGEISLDSLEQAKEISSFSYSLRSLESLLSTHPGKRFISDLIQALENGNRPYQVTSSGLTFCLLSSSLKVLRQQRVILLDATPCIPVWNELFPNNTVYGDLCLTPGVHVTQVIGRIFPFSSTEKDLKALPDILSDILEGFKQPLVILPKAWVGQHSFGLPEGSQITHFGGETRGSNAFKECDALVMIGHFQPPINAVELMAAALRSPESVQVFDQIEKLTPVKLMGKAVVPNRRQWHHTDALVHAMAEHAIYSEYAQAIGRLRGLRRKNHTPVFLIGAPVMPMLPVNNVIE